MWLGGSDLTTEGSFEWISHRCIFSSFTNWHNNEPTDRDDVDCLQIYRGNGHLRWDDTRCSQSKRFICEFITF